MFELIVLGQVPGTQLQITFVFWLSLVVGLLVSGLVWVEHRTHAFRNWIIIINLLLITRNTPVSLQP
ncbi:MAG: hypothetical protein AAB834_06690 [Patescibacteria group bacterium]